VLHGQRLADYRVFVRLANKQYCYVMVQIYFSRKDPE
jgi:hypothetical protein